MRRFKTSHEGCVPDENVLALWKCDEGTGVDLTDSSYSATFSLNSLGPGNTGATTSLFDGARGSGSQKTAVGGSAWFASNVVGGYGNCRTDWSLAMWVKLETTNATAALFEHAAMNDAEGGFTTADYMGLGVYRLANGKVRVGWDHDPGGGLLELAADFDATVGTTAVHLGLRRDYLGLDDRPLGSTATARLSLFLNGEKVGTQFLRRNDTTVSNYGINGRFVFGASYRWRTASDTPAFSTVPVTYDDVAFFKTAVPDGKFRDLYRNGVRPWDEARLFESGTGRSQARVFVEDGDGLMVDLTALYDVNWVTAVNINEDVESMTKSASVTLTRRVGSSLDLSPLNTTSRLNLDATGTFDALLSLRHKVRIVVATVPAEWKIQGWEYETHFEGYIDDLSTEATRVSLKCVDRMAELSDVFQIDPKAYDYYTVETLAETHIQTIIANNSPALFTGDATLSFAWLGGFTPLLYTPASSGWFLRYDDTPSGNVDKMTQSVADQIAWDLRYKWREGLHRHDLTFFEPPRDLTLEIEKNTQGPNGEVYVHTTTPHGLVVGQSVTVDGTNDLDGTDVVSEVLTARCFRLGYATPSYGTDTGGTLVYSACATVPDTLVSSLEPLRKGASDIRNACIVRYGRDTGSSATVSVTVSGAAAGPLFVDMTDEDRASLWPYFESGQSFTISDCADTDANGDWTISSMDTSYGLQTTEPLDGAVSSQSAVLSSPYVAFQTAVSVSTTSVAAYGYRPAAVFEASVGNIDTKAEAKKLADAVVSDLGAPTIDTRARLTACAPWFELHDVLSLSPDKKGRYTTELAAAVVSVEHTFDSAGGQTTLGLRKETPTRGKTWVDRVTAGLGKPMSPVKNLSDYALDTIGLGISSQAGQTIGVQMAPKSNLDGGRRRMRSDVTELHVSSVEDFAISQDTLAVTSRNNAFDITKMPDGAPLSPGVPLYLRAVQRDIFGNLTLASAATSIISRFTDQAPAAKVMRVESGIVSVSDSDIWTAFPFNVTSTSPAFDRYGNFTPGPTTGNPFVEMVEPPTDSFWRMPCDGLVKITARIGLENTFTGAKPLTPATIKIGAFRLGSSIQGSNVSTPFYLHTAPASRGYFGDYIAADPYGAYSLISGGAQTLFWDFTTETSAYSGDYVVIGFFSDATGIAPADAVFTSSASASWAHFSVQQD